MRTYSIKAVETVFGTDTAPRQRLQSAPKQTAAAGDDLVGVLLALANTNQVAALPRRHLLLRTGYNATQLDERADQALGNQGAEVGSEWTTPYVPQS
jgi:hypothetical protein